MLDLDRLVERAHTAKAFPEAIRFAQKRLAADPLREDAARELMALRFEAGDRDDRIWRHMPASTGGRLPLRRLR